MKQHFRFILPVLFMAVTFFLSPGGAVLGQEETAATVSGQVTDSAGASVAGATVVVVNDATGQERRVLSNEEGNYAISPLSPGTYTFSVEQTNFKKHLETGLILNARDRRLLNVALEAGSVSEVVTVTAEEQIVQDSPTGQTLISGTQVVEIPLVNRDFT